MTLKQILVSSTAAAALTLAGAAMAEQPATPFVSGDEPMEVGSGAQTKAPHPDAMAQEKTEAMLKSESGEISGNMNPISEGDAAQMKAPVPDAAAQAKTEKMLKEEAGMLSGDQNPIDEGDAAEMKEPK